VPEVNDTPLPPLPPLDPVRRFNLKSPVSWGIRDPERFQKLMDEAASLVVGGFYLGDNLFTWTRNLSLLEDEAFRNAWQANLLGPADEAIAWRRYILCTAACHAVHLEGDFVECGTLGGTGMKTVIDYFGREHFAKTFWAYDTFDSNPTGVPQFAGQQAGLFEQVRARFAGYERVRLVKGLLPASLDGASPERIGWLHIDLNNAEFEIAVLDVLFERMVPGGLLILDDYEWAGGYRGQKAAEDPWFTARKYRVMPLPTGQGLVIKR
jgi:hypothetical protein